MLHYVPHRFVSQRSVPVWSDTFRHVLLRNSPSRSASQRSTSFCYATFRGVLLRNVLFRFAMLRSVPFCYATFRAVLLCYVSFRFAMLRSVPFSTLRSALLRYVPFRFVLFRGGSSSSHTYSTNTTVNHHTSVTTPSALPVTRTTVSQHKSSHTHTDSQSHWEGMVAMASSACHVVGQPPTRGSTQSTSLKTRILDASAAPSLWLRVVRTGRRG